MGHIHIHIHLHIHIHIHIHIDIHIHIHIHIQKHMYNTFVHIHWAFRASTWRGLQGASRAQHLKTAARAMNPKACKLYRFRV